MTDTRYCSKENLSKVEKTDIDVPIATGRKESLPHHMNQFLKTLHAVNKQTDVLRTKNTKKDYSRRKVIVEPVFEQMKVKQKTVKLYLRETVGKRRGESSIASVVT